MNTRTPASEAGMQADITECSDSGVMISASKWPSAWKSVSSSSTGVCGVIGYTGTTCGRASRAAQATAWLPVSSTGFSAIVHRNSSSIVIEPVGHSLTHTPQPLQ